MAAKEGGRRRWRDLLSPIARRGRPWGSAPAKPSPRRSEASEDVVPPLPAEMFKPLPPAHRVQGDRPVLRKPAAAPPPPKAKGSTAKAKAKAKAKPKPKAKAKAKAKHKAKPKPKAKPKKSSKRAEPPATPKRSQQGQKRAYGVLSPENERLARSTKGDARAAVAPKALRRPAAAPVGILKKPAAASSPLQGSPAFASPKRSSPVQVLSLADFKGPSLVSKPGGRSMTAARPPVFASPPPQAERRRKLPRDILSPMARKLIWRDSAASTRVGKGLEVWRPPTEAGFEGSEAGFSQLSSMPARPRGNRTQEVLWAIQGTMRSSKYEAAPVAGVKLHPCLLTTFDSDGYPSVRTVIPKRVDPEFAEVIFSTNINANKVQEIQRNPCCSLHYQDQRKRGGWATFKGRAELLLTGGSEEEVKVRVRVERCECMSYNIGPTSADDGEGAKPAVLTSVTSETGAKSWRRLQ